MPTVRRVHLPDRISNVEAARKLCYSRRTMYARRLLWGLTVCREGLGKVYYRCDEVAAAMEAIEQGRDPRRAVAAVKAERK